MSNDTVAEPETKSEVPSTEDKVEDSKSEEVNVDSPNEVATEPVKKEEQVPNDGEHATEEVKGSDEPKTDKVEDVEDKKKDHKAQRDYAFIKEKQKRKALQEKYDRDTEAKDKRIKELEEALEKYKPLTSKDFKQEDGSVNFDAYTDWKLKERDMQSEVDNLKKQKQQDLLQYQIEQDRIATERCFQGKELEDYNELMNNNAAAFASEIHKVDSKNTLFTYLDTVQDYPIVLRELMTNPYPYLHRIYRSTDADSIKHNAALVVNEILDAYEAKQKSVVQPDNSSVAQPTKPAIPVIGKQITNASASTPSDEGSLVSSMSSINKYLSKHKRW